MNKKSRGRYFVGIIATLVVSGAAVTAFRLRSARTTEAAPTMAPPLSPVAAGVEADFAHDRSQLKLKKPVSPEMAKMRAKRIQAILSKDKKTLMELARLLEAKHKFSAARDVLLDAAHLGDASAKLRLGFYAAHGLGGKSDPAEAAKWYEDAAKTGSPDSYAFLARMYTDGRTVPPDPQKAAMYTDMGIAAGSAEALFIKGAALLDGGDPSSALAYLRQAAEKNNADAQRLISRLYQEGKVLPQDLKAAEEWARAAAGNGSVDAQIDLAQLLLNNGSAGQTDAAAGQEAISLLDQAAAQNSSRASLEQAKLTLEQPQLTADDVASARQHAQEAASKGNIEAPFALAALSADGNSAEALAWLQKGVALNDWRSKYAMDLSSSGIMGQADAIKAAASAQFDEYVDYSLKKNTEGAGFTPPSPVNMPMPAFPAGLSAVSIQGAVTAEFTVDEQGKPGAVTILSATHPELEAAVKTVISTWQFKPALKNGLPVAQKLRVPIQFTSTK